MQIVKTVVAGSSAAILLAALPAAAQWRTAQLKGDYAVTGTNICVVSGAIITPTSYTPPAGFTPSLVPIGPAGVNSFASTDVYSFNGDGTGSISGRSIIANLNQPGSVGPQSAGAISAADHVIPIAYSVADDRTLTIIPGPSLNTFVAGPRTGQQNSTSGVPPQVGRVSVDGKSIVFGSFDPAVETLTRVFPPVDNPIEAVRICHRSHTGARIGGGSQDDDN
ncbi:MAG TPA: hypothetical protein VFK92_14725 [Burkholderiales bacterium]|nr:hypothetical protein [Burkholderiales bacterium]